eukprot:5052055-Pyramimonas_sp.AAC.1
MTAATFNLKSAREEHRKEIRGRHRPQRLNLLKKQFHELEMALVRIHEDKNERHLKGAAGKIHTGCS